METLDTPAPVVPVIPGYLVTRQLGQGSSGTVWLATRDRDGARFAIKCAGVGGAVSDAQAGVEISREVQLLLGFRHQHLVRVHDVVPVAGPGGATSGIVMDYAAGGSLANLLAGRRKLGIGEAVTMLTPIAQALEYLHVNGAVHGDVSPGNILFTAEGMPLLADLGIASVLGGPSGDTDSGTPGFIEPVKLEWQAQPGHGVLRPQRDVYSLAAVGWYCMTGTTPEPVQHRPPLSLLVPGVPQSLVAALEAALDEDPHMRPSAGELGTAIFRSAAPEALDLSGAVHPSVIPELLTRRQARRRPPRPGTSWMRSLRKFRPVRLRFLRRQSGRPRWQRISWPTGMAVRLAMAGVLLGVAGWIAWQQYVSVTVAPKQESTAGSEAPSGEASTSSDSADLPVGLSRDLGSADPAAAVRAMSSVRDMAFRQGQLELLALINAPGSPAAAADELVTNHLRETGAVFSGFITSLSAVTVEEPSADDDVLVAVTASTSAYEERIQSGEIVRTQGAGTPRDLRLHLLRSDGRWWLFEILAPSGVG
ncbi:Serine/threonine protein kinase [Arthrobacter sp. cf158]|uniref:serine/threonine protein kinase n=1 Tax=Arthrobacter sp. cf158 TaxID=1761744 RepID=UPI000894F8CC|nr:serine/threonine-protein kinase [Arthrobacter sp. cf158]SDW83224.1 Serine/threonine protein kinase [Arthrobacter sp. cf158]